MIRLHQLRGVDDIGLFELIEQVRAATPEARLAMAEGDAWSSSKNLQRFPAVSRLLEQVRAALRLPQAHYDVWANVLPAKARIKLHDHGGATTTGRAAVVSGVYYPSDSAGAIVFPTVGLKLQPRQGIAIVFPPNLPHRVEAHSDPAPRYSIAFNGALCAETQKEN